ncbi:hypothetical protein LEMLEM_LOCUS24857, partial [Lemmus lemmus]
MLPGEMTQQLRVSTALPDDTSSVFPTPVLGGSKFLFQLQGLLHPFMASAGSRTHTHTHTFTCIIKNNLKKKKKKGHELGGRLVGEFWRKLYGGNGSGYYKILCICYVKKFSKNIIENDTHTQTKEKRPENFST